MPFQEGDFKNALFQRGDFNPIAENQNPNNSLFWKMFCIEIPKDIGYTFGCIRKKFYKNFFDRLFVYNIDKNGGKNI